MANGKSHWFTAFSGPTGKRGPQITTLTVAHQKQNIPCLTPHYHRKDNFRTQSQTDPVELLDLVPQLLQLDLPNVAFLHREITTF